MFQTFVIFQKNLGWHSEKCKKLFKIVDYVEIAYL